ncbi:2-amino-4-hydroxy-6-hydroxymethyldihydropteridine diphosphokinase [Heliophilum fasciatum]|uniref:Bifunctional folate synthesis protein n=1 Tax=Heliophilum fasciatum TaxID=35700 RepID=A0A4R2RY14_9FIRM|nr:2-amino-4-hydroxy-6-hydroxymethyldihydropteridine diphosphokinase [Heliophilum fasciatum]MCW2277070.1 dihydroneopterin aldolase/2-amino-4-hydroxy-6-hydroxymethyldihydropteridine diphosphokinase [Heliophilum fasciatum]TCP68404.1 dihydroneopterin aldolase/2-amino-4-hydroxy-6-hydroxymethyldihydropteridine diphosphokinase [Heliophilum fasciatum]
MSRRVPEGDRIGLYGLRFYGYHGALPEEAVLGQPFDVDAELFLDLAPAGRQDAVTATVHYGEVYARMHAMVETKRYQTIEALAEALAAAVLEDFPLVEAIRLRVEKPKAPVPGIFRAMAVEIVRYRQPQPEPTEQTVAIALGSNLGDRVATLAEALTCLATMPGLTLLAHSSWYETAPVGAVPQGAFLNGVALFRTSWSPWRLLVTLQAVEQQFGRQREVKWGPRTLDLDILFVGDQVIDAPGLQVPHPEIGRRAFVLVPLAEVAPDWVFPDGRTTRELLQALDEHRDHFDVVLHIERKSIRIDALTHGDGSGECCSVSAIETADREGHH